MVGVVTVVLAVVGVVAAVVAVAVELFGGEFLAVASCCYSGVSTRPFHFNSYVSGTLVGVVAVAVVAVAVQLFSWEFLAVAWCSCSGVRARPLCLSNFVSGTLSVGRLGVVLAARTSFAQGVDNFALDYDAILTAMYALTIGAKGDCYLCVLPGPGIEAAALGANESALPGTAPAEALHTFTLDSGLSLYTLATEPPEVAASAQVSASGQVAPPCSCHLLSHQTLLWHHRLGHPSLPRFRGMHSRLRLSGLPRSVPPLSPSPAPPRLPCVEGRQRAASHSSSFSLTTAPLQTLHMDVWCPALISGQGCERYFLLVVDNYTRYTMVFPLRSKDQFHQDIPVLCLHFYRGGEFSSDLLRELCRGEGILQSFTLPTSPQKNGIAQRCIGLVMEVARTSMIHAAAPHFLWPLAVPYAAHQLNLWPRVSLPKTSPTLHWTGKDVTFDESVPFYRLFPYRSAPPRTPPLFLAPGPPPVDFLPPHGPSPSGVSQVDHLLGTVPVKVAGASGAARGAASGGAASRGAEPRGAEPEGAESRGVEPQGTASSGGPAGASQGDCLSPQQLREWFAQRTRLRSGAAGARDSAAGDIGAGGVGATSLGGAGVTAGASGTGDATAAGPGGARTKGTGAAGTGSVGGTGAGGAGAGDPVEPGGAGAGGAGAGATRAVDPGVGGARDGGIGAGGARAGGAGVGATGAIDPGAGGAMSGGTPASPLPAPSTYSEQIGGLTERCEPESRPASPVRAVRTGRRVPRPRPPPVPGTHAMALRPSSVPLRVPLPPPPESSLRADPSPESDLARAASPTISCLLATVVTDPSFESTAASSLVAELVDFAAACCLDYAIALVADSESASPPSMGGECALGTDVLEDRQEDFESLAAAVPRFASMLLAHEGDTDAPDIPTPRSYAEAITGPYSSQWQAAMDAEMASWKPTGTYVDAIPPSWANIVNGMWIFRVKRPPGSPSAFKACYVAGGFNQRQGVDYFHTFSPTPKMTTLWVLLHVAAQHDYKLHSLDFSTVFLQGSLHEEIWLCRPPGFTGSFRAGTQWSLRRPVYSLCQAPCEWHDTLRTTLAALGFAPSTADPSPFRCTNTSLPLIYVLVYVDDLVFATVDTEALTLVKSELQKRHTSTDLGELRNFLGLQITQDRARRTITLTQSHMVH
ncbi:unnamed protein product [Closterium sp. NIES-54]